jgi:hypothetical protein
LIAHAVGTSIIGSNLLLDAIFGIVGWSSVPTSGFLTVLLSLLMYTVGFLIQFFVTGVKFEVRDNVVVPISAENDPALAAPLLSEIATAGDLHALGTPAMVAPSAAMAVISGQAQRYFRCVAISGAMLRATAQIQSAQLGVLKHGRVIVGLEETSITMWGVQVPRIRSEVSRRQSHCVLRQSLLRQTSRPFWCRSVAKR